jgi:protease-4
MFLRRLPVFLLVAALNAALAAATVLAAQPAAAQADDDKDTAPVLGVFTFGGTVTEAPMADDFPFATSTESFKSLLTRLKKISQDESARGVVLLVSGTSLGRSQIEEVRSVLDDIKKAGKRVVAHTDSVSMSSYLLLSSADQISVVPTGDVWINGLYGESLHLRGMLDKLGVKPDYLTCGDYKSAAEMFTRRTPSPEAQENVDWLLDGIFNSYVEMVATARNVEKDQVRQWIDQGVYSAAQAKEAGIIDAVEHRQEFVARLKKDLGEKLAFDKKYGKKKAMTIDLSSPLGILKFYGELLSGPKKSKPSKQSVAIVYVEGMILPGSSDPSGFPLSLGGIAYSTPIAKALDKAAEDDTVKAVVLRVDSPGGSAVASEIILHATKRVAAKKPLVVSMGNVAGSGGYYVACGSQNIFADSTTITGSIGVVGGKFATTDMWNKVGINWSSTKRGANADILASSRVFTDEQRQIVQDWMDHIYDVFKGHVVAIRGDKLKKEIDELAGGRVYTGKQALELGLIDKIGGLEDALAFAASEAGLKEYDVRVLPKPKSFIELLLSDLQDGDSDKKTLSMAIDRLTPRTSLMDLALPELKGLEPTRVRSVATALMQMQLMQQERVLTAMPVINIRD